MSSSIQSAALLFGGQLHAQLLRMLAVVAGRAIFSEDAIHHPARQAMLASVTGLQILKQGGNAVVADPDGNLLEITV